LSWTEGGAPLAVHAVLAFAYHAVVFFIIAVGVVAALVHADFASDTTVWVTFYDVFWANIAFH
jgi:hypothetical protein